MHTELCALRSGHTVTAVGDRIYVFGGQGENMANVEPDLFVLDTLSMSLQISWLSTLAFSTYI